MCAPVQVGAFLEYRCKAQVIQMHRDGEGDVEVDNRPWSRYGQTMCQHHDKFYIFGGSVVKDGAKTNELFWLTADRMEWHLQPCKGDSIPCARDGHCAIIDSENNRMVVFGGRSQVRFSYCCERKHFQNVFAALLTLP